mmetsp:Transcript_330/g.760  ORF Transcript_330/g.760 Transcript_330/m.760 type:complete len:164 (-) Transcript_330:247-738(-)
MSGSVFKSLTLGSALAVGGFFGTKFYEVQKAQSAADAAKQFAENQRKELLSCENKIQKADKDIAEYKKAVDGATTSLAAAEKALALAVQTKAASAKALAQAEEALVKAQQTKMSVLKSRDTLEVEVVKADDAAIVAAALAEEARAANEPAALLAFAKSLMSPK